MKIFIFSLLMIGSLFAASIPEISPREAMELLAQKKAIVIDVREIEELKNGRVKNAMLFPSSFMNTDAFEEMVLSLPTDKTLILFCQSGRRSAIMGKELKKRGYIVFDMGSFETFKGTALPITY